MEYNSDINEVNTSEFSDNNAPFNNHNNVTLSINTDLDDSNEIIMDNDYNVIDNVPEFISPQKPIINKNQNINNQPKVLVSYNHNTKRLKHVRTIYFVVDTKEYLSTQPNHNMPATLNVVYSYSNELTKSESPIKQNNNTNTNQNNNTNNINDAEDFEDGREASSSNKMYICSLPIKASKSQCYRRRQEIYDHELPCSAVTFNNQSENIQLLQCNNYQPFRMKTLSSHSSPAHQSSRAFPVGAPNPEFVLIASNNGVNRNSSSTSNSPNSSFISDNVNTNICTPSTTRSSSFSTPTRTSLPIFSEVPVKLITPDYSQDHILLQPASVNEINQLKVLNRGLELSPHSSTTDNPFNLGYIDNNKSITSTQQNAPYLVHVTSKSNSKRTGRKVKANSISNTSFHLVNSENQVINNSFDVANDDDNDRYNSSGGSHSTNCTTAHYLNDNKQTPSKDPFSGLHSTNRRSTTSVVTPEMKENQLHWLVVQEDQVYKLHLTCYLDVRDDNVNIELLKSSLNVAVYYGAYRALDEECPQTFKRSLKTKVEQHLDKNSPITILLMPSTISSEIQSLIQSFASMNIYTIDQCANLYTLTREIHNSTINLAHFTNHQLQLMQRAYKAKQFFIQRKFNFTQQACLTILRSNNDDSYEFVNNNNNNAFYYIDTSQLNALSRSNTPSTTLSPPQSGINSPNNSNSNCQSRSSSTFSIPSDLLLVPNSPASTPTKISNTKTSTPAKPTLNTNSNYNGYSSQVNPRSNVIGEMIRNQSKQSEVFTHKTYGNNNLTLSNGTTNNTNPISGHSSGRIFNNNNNNTNTLDTFLHPSLHTMSPLLISALTAVTRQYQEDTTLEINKAVQEFNNLQMLNKVLNQVQTVHRSRLVQTPTQQLNQLNIRDQEDLHNATTNSNTVNSYMNVNCDTNMRTNPTPNNSPMNTGVISKSQSMNAHNVNRNLVSNFTTKNNARSNHNNGYTLHNLIQGGNISSNNNAPSQNNNQSNTNNNNTNINTDDATINNNNYHNNTGSKRKYDEDVPNLSLLLNFKQNSNGKSIDSTGNNRNNNNNAVNSSKSLPEDQLTSLLLAQLQLLSNNQQLIKNQRQKTDQVSTS